MALCLLETLKIVKLMLRYIISCVYEASFFRDSFTGRQLGTISMLLAIFDVC